MAHLPTMHVKCRRVTPEHKFYTGFALKGYTSGVTLQLEITDVYK